MSPAAAMPLCRAAAALGAVLLAGCAAAPPVPLGAGELALPRWVRVTTHAPGRSDQDDLLAVQQDGPRATRWSLFDPLGMPRARQILQDGKWRNDGFLPPNGQASNLFSAILFAWTPAARLDTAYPGAGWREQAAPGGARTRVLDDGCETRWRIAWAPGASADTFTISQPDGTTWRIAPLQDAP